MVEKVSPPLNETQAPPSLRANRDGVSEELEAVVLRALSRTPADRYSSAAELLDALTAVTPATSTGGAHHVSAVASPAPPVVHHRQRQARIDPHPVHQHRAGAALAVITALLGPAEPQVLAQEVEQRGAQADIDPVIDKRADGLVKTQFAGLAVEHGQEDHQGDGAGRERSRQTDEEMHDQKQEPLARRLAEQAEHLPHRRQRLDVLAGRFFVKLMELLALEQAWPLEQLLEKVSTPTSKRGRRDRGGG